MICLQVLLVFVIVRSRDCTSANKLFDPFKSATASKKNTKQQDQKLKPKSKPTVAAVIVKETNEKKTTIVNDHYGKLTPKSTLATVVTKKPTATKKPAIDTVNDYYPYVDFKFVFPEISPVIEGSRDFLLIVFIISAAKGDKYRQRRDNIRQTWGSSKACENLKALNNPKLKNLKWMYVFVLGKVGPATDDDKRNAGEAKKYNDMLIGDLDDIYINLVIKLYMGKLWAFTLNVKYTLKTDDDVYIRIPGVVEYLVKKGFPARFYGCCTQDHTKPSKVERHIGGKWTVSRRYYPEDKWPPFSAGAFILLSTDLYSILFKQVYVRKPFHTEDTYVAVAMRDSNVTNSKIFSLELRPNMPKLIRTKTNCQILALYGFGHNLDVESSKLLHGRIESMCHKNITTTSC